MKRAIIIVLACILILGISISLAAERSVSVKQKKGAGQPRKIKSDYYALVIGNNNYRNLPKLATAAADAKEVKRVLAEKYGFHARLLLDATRENILDALNEYRKNLGEKDSFLIYYAGHGEYDKIADKAYWLPVDAEKDNPTRWIMAEDITTNIKRISAKHVLIVSDSCYSGALTRSAGTELGKKKNRDEFLRKMMERASRTLMASGGNEPVADAGGRGGHSVFASAFLTALNEADRTSFTAEELFHGRVKAMVAGKSEQVPQYNDIRNSGHEGGDFVFQLAQSEAGRGEREEQAVSDDTSSETYTEAAISSLLIGAQSVNSIAVNPTTNRIYFNRFVNNSTSDTAVVDASDRANPAIVTTLRGGFGLTVNPVTNRIYTTDGYGGNILVYDDATNSLIASVHKGYCHPGMDTDTTTNLIYTASQCGANNDPLQVVNGNTHTIVGGPLGSGGVAGAVYVNSATGRVYVDAGSWARVFGPSPAFSFLTDLTGGSIAGVNPVTNRLYFQPQSGMGLQVLDGNTHALIATISGVAGGAGLLGVNTRLNRLYVCDQTNNVIKVIDGGTNTIIRSFPLDSTMTVTPYSIGVDSAKRRLYVAGRLSDGTTRLYVIQDKP